MERCEIADAAQAGGRTFGSWLRSVGEFLGIPSAAVYVPTAWESVVIPYGALPCAEAYPAKGNWQAHCDEVCRAVGTRWGCDAVFGGLRYALWGGGQKARYVHGSTVVMLTIDGTNIGETHVGRLRFDGATQAGPTAFRIEFGPQDNRQVAYLAETTASRLASGGRLQWRNRVIGPEGDATALVDMTRDYWDGKRKAVQVVTMLRPDWQPEEFIAVASSAYRGIPNGAVIQIETADYQGAAASCTFTGVIVYEPGSMTPATGGGATGGGGYS